VTGIVLAVHGGAGRLARSKREHPKRLVYEDGLKQALQAGHTVLRKGGSSLNAVTKAVSILEDIEVFNAGLGAALCADGSVELSASIMSGKDLSVGAMVGLSRAKNPIRAARTIMGHAHGLLFGRHADAYAEAKGLDMVQPEYFFTRERLRQWEKYKASKKIALDHDEDSAHGTVGAVALDRRGNLAAATSTGGLVNQLPGRVGDTPVIGAGTWAQNGVCAISATGKGDAFARVAFARRVADLIEIGHMGPLEAAHEALSAVTRASGEGGCIILDASGQCFMPFNSKHMLRGLIREDGVPHVAITIDDFDHSSE
jgi:beta-aspartyl-peptidase (threonine type)